MKLNKAQKIQICCAVAEGYRGELEGALAFKIQKQDGLKEMTKLTLKDINPTLEKALVIMAKNHLGLTPDEMTEAKANGKIVYKPTESKDGKHVRTTDGQVYAKSKNGTLKKVGPRKETKTEKRKRRKAERIAAGKER